MNKKINILVVCGGISSEREVSLRSGKAIYEALLKKGYENTSFFDLKQDNMKKILDSKPDIVFLGLHGKGGKSSLRGISKEQVCVLVARDRTKATVSKVACMGRVVKTKVDGIRL